MENSKSKNLSPDWITQGLIDFEYKKYLLLAYLQHTKKQFDEVKLYPALSELLFHYNNLVQIKENKQFLSDKFPKKLSEADIKKLKLTYTSILKDDEMMQEIESVVDFALPRINESVSEGKQIYNWINQSLEIVPIGITPIYFREGYLFLVTDAKVRLSLASLVYIYKYQITLFHTAENNETLRGINLQHIDTLTKSSFQTYENLKIELVRSNRNLPNPATFLMNAGVVCSLENSILPIAKRRLVEYLAILEKN
ncbi:hypothetical protein [Bernardetia sp.]|uniref:hypothetical protein n=1 Tax=Bernardetia sp. TaxID=1937974 RepID=UPI0025BDF164|nr:hypothetical protein [Bernardetia sp.]